MLMNQTQKHIYVYCLCKVVIFQVLYFLYISPSSKDCFYFCSVNNLFYFTKMTFN